MAATRLTDQQERFCREFVRLGVGSRAYRSAYKVRKNSLPATAQIEACRLLADPRISLRVQQLRDKVAEKTVTTVKTLVADLHQARAVALETDQASAAVTATMGIAKLTGHLKDDPTKAGDIHLHFDGLLKGVL